MSKARDLHVVLLAGGSGTRFWPLSRKRRPKQFIALSGDRSLLVQTWRRVRKLAPPSRLWVVAPVSLADDIRAELPQLREDRLVLEPSPRDTAPAIALACARVAAVAPQAVTAIFPTDAVIRDEQAFGRAAFAAADAARQGALVCLGVKPTHPATGYGYLKCAKKPRGLRPVDVERFVEKPDAAKARRLLASGDYLWNAGMFVWRVERFLAELERTAPEIHAAVLAEVAGKRGAWARATRLSVDFAVMEKARGVRLVPLDAGWDDVGSWDAAARLREEQGSDGEGAIRVDSPGSVVFGGKKLVAVVDLPDVVVVETDDAVLVVPRKSSEKVKKVVEALADGRRRDLL